MWFIPLVHRADVIFFFFSSRRRHTRWPRDWSSDVCSSDLAADTAISVPRRVPGLPPLRWRSEERRVGKECRSRWTTQHEKKNTRKDKEEMNEWTRIDRTDSRSDRRHKR